MFIKYNKLQSNLLYIVSDKVDYTVIPPNIINTLSKIDAENFLH